MPAPGAEGGRARASYCGMRAIWKGAVSFGLVNVPVRLYSATENHDVQFRQVHREDGGRIRYKRICSVDGAEVSFDDIAKGFETEDGQMVVLTDDDFAHLPAQSSKEIAVEKFVPAEQIDPTSPTTLSRTSPRPRPMRCCVMRSSRPSGWPWSRCRSGPG